MTKPTDEYCPRCLREDEKKVELLPRVGRIFMCPVCKAVWLPKPPLERAASHSTWRWRR